MESREQVKKLDYNNYQNFLYLGWDIHDDNHIIKIFKCLDCDLICKFIIKKNKLINDSFGDDEIKLEKFLEEKTIIFEEQNKKKLIRQKN